MVGTGQPSRIDRMDPELGLHDGEALKLVDPFDNDTSDVLLMARTGRPSAALARLFRNGSPRKQEHPQAGVLAQEAVQKLRH